MTSRFNPRGFYVDVRARLVGPAGEISVVLALDTGATWTTVTPDTLEAAGYDPRGLTEMVEVVTASGHERVRRVELAQISALGVRRAALPALCHGLPAGVRVAGLLGLDFFRGHRLEIDFTQGTVDLR